MGDTGKQLVAQPPMVLEAGLTSHQLHGETEAVGPGGQQSPTYLRPVVDFPQVFVFHKLHQGSPLPYLHSRALARD